MLEPRERSELEQEWFTTTADRLALAAEAVVRADVAGVAYAIKTLRTRVADFRDAQLLNYCPSCGGVPGYTCGEADRVLFACRNYRGWDE